MEVGFIYTENFSQYNFGSGHPLTPKRIELTYDLMKAYHLLENSSLKLITPRNATERNAKLLTEIIVVVSQEVKHIFLTGIAAFLVDSA